MEISSFFLFFEDFENDVINTFLLLWPYNSIILQLFFKFLCNEKHRYLILSKCEENLYTMIFLSVVQ